MLEATVEKGSRAIVVDGFWCYGNFTPEEQNSRELDAPRRWDLKNSGKHSSLANNKCLEGRTRKHVPVSTLWFSATK